MSGIRNPATRRSFLRSAGAAALSAPALVTARGASRARPNVLFIACDDLNDSVEGMGGHAQARTPHIHRLMERGVQFTNAHNNQPWCAPSRASLWSGLYPFTSRYHGSGHWRKHPVLGRAVTLMEHLGKSGYGVYGTGKLFHNGHEPKDLYTQYGHDPDFGPWPWDGKERREHPSLACLFETAYYKNLPLLHETPPYQTWGPLSDVPAFKADPAKGAPGYRGWWLYQRPFRYVSEQDREPMPDEACAEWAAEVLSRRHERPFFLGVGFSRPHIPLYAPKKYFDMFPPDRIQLPPYLSNDVDDCARALLLADPKGLEKFRLLHAAGGEIMWKRWIQAYLACVTFVDDQVGKVLDALERSPHARNTIVILTSDHGFHMGEKDYIFKNSLWEESTRVPLVIDAPELRRRGARCDHPVSLIDMYPTIADLCGLPADPNARGNGYRLDGYSIRPFLDDPHSGSWSGPSVAVTQLGAGERAHYSIRGRQWRYTLCANGEEELYDHAADPNEWTNLAPDPKFAAVKADLKRELLRITRKA
ncbi:MAG: sulfatase [Acidobacteria bacterium]|nr:sulfatase [Acidobacteriota bacterium]